MKRRTIICLGAKRSGTTAVHRVFQRHPDVGICHPDQSMGNWEPNFWNLAVSALTHSRPRWESYYFEMMGRDVSMEDEFAERMFKMAPDVDIQFPISEADIFDLWDRMLDRYGPVLFDKSPRYLGSEDALKYILKYIERGNDVRVFGLIRDPRDTITSQYELWTKEVPYATPDFREEMWIDYYRRFEWFQGILGEERCPIIRYEDFSRDPGRWIPFILDHCGLKDAPEIYSHVRPVSIGRYYRTKKGELLSWNPSDELCSTVQRYGYDVRERPLIFVVARKVRPYTAPVSRRFRWGFSALKVRMKKIAKGIIVSLIERISAGRLESIIIDLIKRRSGKLSAGEALKFLFRLDNALYRLEGEKAVEYGGGTHTKHRHIGYHDFFVENIGYGESVIDIGCGIGALAYDVAERSKVKVVGIDISGKSIEEANSRYSHPGVKYILGDAHFDLPSESFDVVILSNVIEHIENRVGFIKKVGNYLLDKPN